MCNIQITGYDHRLLFLQLLKICTEIIFPFHPVIQSCKLTLGIWCINCHKIEILKLTGDHASLLVMLFNPQSIGYR